MFDNKEYHKIWYRKNKQKRKKYIDNYIQNKKDDKITDYYIKSLELGVLGRDILEENIFTSKDYLYLKQLYENNE